MLSSLPQSSSLPAGLLLSFTSPVFIPRTHLDLCPFGLINSYLLSNFKFTKFKVFVEIIKEVGKYSTSPLPSRNAAELYFPATLNLDLAACDRQNDGSPKMSMSLFPGIYYNMWKGRIKVAHRIKVANQMT